MRRAPGVSQMVSRLRKDLCRFLAIRQSVVFHRVDRGEPRFDNSRS